MSTTNGLQPLSGQTRTVKIVYLDLNHWIYLAQAFAGREVGRQYVDVLEHCLRARSLGSVTFPVSDSIYIEISRIAQHRQQRDLRQVIEALSRNQVIMARPDIAAHEVEALLDHLVGPSVRPINMMSYLDWGAMRAFGLDGTIMIQNTVTGQDVTSELIGSVPGLAPQIRAATVLLQRQMIDGPATDEEEAALLGDGWDPHAASSVADERARQENEQVDRLDSEPRFRKGRIRDVVAYREWVIELMDMLTQGRPR